MLVSHHGAVERGSPKPPMTLEATIVHLIDHLDSQVDAVARVVGGPRGEDGWTEHVKLQDRSYYAGRPATPADESND
jgi:3'-5' exoribonuclease